MKLPLATAFNSDCTACTMTTSAAPSSPVAIALPVPSHMVNIFTLFTSSNFLFSTSSNPVSHVDVVVASRNSCGACWTHPENSDINIETKIIFDNRFFILPPYVHSNITHINKVFEKKRQDRLVVVN